MRPATAVLTAWIRPSGRVAYEPGSLPPSHEQLEATLVNLPVLPDTALKHPETTRWSHRCPRTIEVCKTQSKTAPTEKLLI